MIIKALRLSFIQLETITGPLASLKAQTIPYQFLLSQALFQGELSNALAGTGAPRVPWDDGVGKLFWYYYLEQTSVDKRKGKASWEKLVPLQTDLEGTTISAGWVSGTVEAHAYLYPWGIGLIVDVSAQGSWTLEEAVEFAFKVRHDGKYDWTVNGTTTPTSMNGLIERAIAVLRSRAYGPAMDPGQAGDAFSVVTVTDAEGADATVAVENKKELHRVLEAWTGWSPQWKISGLKNLGESAIDIMRKVSPDGHVLYGGRRGRAVWFPAGFHGANPRNPDGLECYHQNLMMSSLQTESLCRLSQAVAKQLAAGQTMGQFSVTYGNCARLAAGILGRLYGSPTFYDSYRSQSLRDQIKRTYFDAVNAVRTASGIGMPPLS